MGYHERLIEIYQRGDEMAVEMQVGDICLTPFPPAGKVKIESVVQVNDWPSCGRKIANVVYIGDHPHGYEDGSRGQYYLDELKKCEA